MSQRQPWTHREKRSNLVQSYQQLRDIMRHLGYPDGEAAHATANALVKVGAVESASLPSQIATEYLKHDPTFMKGEQ